MDLHGKSHAFDGSPTHQRAGLRISVVPDHPTNLFEVVEMAVLVLVAALAMASIIVASVEGDGDLRIQAASGSRPDTRPAQPERAPREAHPTDATRTVDVASSR